MASTSTKVGHGLAKFLGIKLDPYRTYQEDMLRGESVMSVDTSDTFVEEEPTSAEWLRRFTPSGKGIVHYLLSLFPFVHWIGHYNWQWAVGDLVAG
jgi:solute carrier family 26 (sodium-independent sulfate anion transporter), member 11